MEVPLIQDLLSEAGDIGYACEVHGDTHVSLFLELHKNHKGFATLVKYALLVQNSLVGFDYELASEGRDDFTEVISYESQLKTLESLEKKPENHQKGWIGELITDFVLRHFFDRHRDLLDFAWEIISPPKANTVTDSQLDIIVAYELNNQRLGHICGEVKTYRDLGGAKNNAYHRLLEAHNWENNREAEIRAVLTPLLRERSQISPKKAANLHLKGDRSFLPSLLHHPETSYKSQATFSDMSLKFTLCTRATQRIGIQISILDFDDFFEAFVIQMRQQVKEWHKLSKTKNNV